MSFFSDLFEGNFGNLGTDIVDAPSSLVNHPDELAETLGVVGLGLGGAGALGAFGDLGAGAAAATDAAAAADPAAAAATGDLATQLGIGDIGTGLATDTAAATDLAAAADPLASTIGGLDTATLDALPSDVVASFADSGAPVDAVGGIASDLGTIPVDAAGNLTQDIGAVTPSDISEGTATDTTAATTPATAAADTAATPSQLPTGPGGVDTQPASLDAANKAFGAFNPTSFAANASNAGVTGFGTDVLNSLGGWGGVARLGLGAAPLALALGMGNPSLPSAGQAALGQAQNLSAQGQADLASAKAGVLNAGQTAALGKMNQDLLNQWRQTLFNQGVQDPTKDSRWPDILATIDAQVTQQTQTFIQQNIQNALQETGQAQQALLSISQMQMNADQNFTNTLVNATKSLGLAASGASGAVKLVAA